MKIFWAQTSSQRARFQRALALICSSSDLHNPPTSRDARQDLFECERGCGFRGPFADVEKHEVTCKYVA